MSNEHPDMSGSGCDDPEQIECPTCNGGGRLCNCGTPLDGSHDHITCGESIECDRCYGSGYISPADPEPEMDDVL